jgi:NTE family protein
LITCQQPHPGEGLIGGPPADDRRNSKMTRLLHRRRFVQGAAALGFMPLWARSPDLPAVPAAREPTVAVCFGSGAVHGYAHVGAIRAFEAVGLRPDVITGTSVGAIAGVLWASGHEAAAIEAIANDPDWRDSIELRLPALGFGRLDGLRDMVDRHTGRRPIETLPIRFAAVATDLDDGRSVILDHGPAGPAVAASSSVPLRHEPVTIDGRRLVDGALSAPVPIDAARELGADFTIAVDVAYRPYEAPISGISDVAFQMFHILVNRLIDEQIRRADFAIRFDVHQVMSEDNGSAALIRAGEAAVRRRWPQLRRALAAARLEAATE